IRASVERLDFYGQRTRIFNDQISAAGKQLNRAKLVATQNVGSGLYVGGSKVASGILFIIPGYLHDYNSNKGQTPGRVTNHLLLAASIVGLPASGFKILDTLRIQVRGEIDRHNLAKQHKLPSELLANRLKALEEAEAALQAKN
ncbi:MAG: hypothetical protein K2X27_05685, partial [Candidatus Obscuribacterales bacterium]|nr:hypothetical protein [Candidatus Obscuribacterales bacterium]